MNKKFTRKQVNIKVKEDFTIDQLKTKAINNPMIYFKDTPF